MVETPPRPTVILNVDDDEANRYAVTRMLRRGQFEVIEAATGGEALRLAAERHPDLVLLDVKLPDTSGLEVCRRLKADPATASIPIVHLSASLIESGDRARGLEGGADGYLVRPVEPPELIATVKALLRTREAERQARLLAQQWQTTFDAIRDGVALLDRGGRVVRCNRAMEHILQQPARAVIGHRFDDLLAEAGPPEGDAGTGDGASPTRGADGGSGQGPRVGEARDLALRGRWFAFGSDALADEQGRPEGSVCVLSDITERKQLEDQLRQRADDLAEADRRKDEFLAMLAHELRNPLAPVLNALEVMRRAGRDPEALEQSRATAERQIRHMARLIDDLLDVSRITRRRIELRMEPVDLAAIVTRAVDAVRPFIEARGHDLDVSIPPGPLRLLADPMRLEQVLANLLNNAAKYTTGPGGRIRLSAERAGDEAVVRVADNGVGIPADVLPHVFGLFIQAEGSIDRSQGGLGIGLTLVRSLTALHGGRVEAACAGPGRGSEFTLHLPLAPAATGGPVQPAGSMAPEAAPAAPRRILVVDDNVDAATVLARLLALDGHEVRLAHDGPACLEIARDYVPDLVLLDIGLPGMDGYQVAARLRELPGLADLVLVALTGYGQEEARARGRQAGFDEHMVKPVDLNALRALLARLGPRP